MSRWFSIDRLKEITIPQKGFLTTSVFSGESLTRRDLLGETKAQSRGTAHADALKGTREPETFICTK